VVLAVICGCGLATIERKAAVLGISKSMITSLFNATLPFYFTLSGDQYPIMWEA